MPNRPADQIVWIDCEMTGLDPDRDGLCEIAVIVTDFELQAVHPGFEIVINPGSEQLEQMGDFVRQMHTDSGLLSRIEQGVTVADAEQAVIAYLAEHVPSGLRPLVAGNTIGMDRRFIAKYMPLLESKLHYRSIDVSTLKELSRQWYPAVFYGAPAKRGGHRALADIAESIQEMAYFRDAVLVAQPGPTKAQSTALAEQVTQHYAELIDGEALEASSSTLDASPTHSEAQ